MKQKTIKVWYWIVTILFAAAMLSSGIMSVLATEQGSEIILHLGYPLYINIILGLAKILGAIALLQPRFKTIKEWAYAGFTFDLLGASLSFALAGDGIGAVLSPLPFFIVLMISYFLWKKYIFQHETN